MWETSWRNIGETKKRVLTQSIELKKRAGQENGNHWAQLNIPKIVMGGLIDCIQKHLQSYPTYTKAK